MRFIFSLFGLIFFSTLSAQTNLIWARGMGGITNDVGKALQADSAGNTYVTGCFSDTIDIDPGPGLTQLISAGGDDIFVAKFNSTGDLVWADRMGGTEDDCAISIYLAFGPGASPRVFITGYFRNTIDADPGAGEYNLVSAGFQDGFIISVTPDSGALLNAFGLGGPEDDAVLSITGKNNPGGAIFVTGVFRAEVDFDPGLGITNLLADEQDIFIAKYDLTGNYGWAKRIGAAGFDGAVSIAADASANVYTTGYFSETVDFNPGAGVNTLTSVTGGSDIFISKLDLSGNYIWAKNIGGPSYNASTSIKVDVAGNCFFTGTFGDVVDFNPGAATNNLSALGSNDIFVCKLNASGNYVWAVNMGGLDADAIGNSIALDDAGSIYTVGSFLGSVDFNPGAGVNNLTSVNYDIFLSQLDPLGNFVRAIQMGGVLIDVGNGLALAPMGKVFLTGLYQDTADFNPTLDSTLLISAGLNDIFIVKLGPDILWTGNVSNVWSNPLNWGSGTVPGIGSSVIIPGGLVRYPTVLTSTEIKSLSVENGASVTLGTGRILKINGH